MIGAAGNQAGYVTGAEARGNAKRADAVGQQAKAVVTVAREAGAELPANARGLAASAVARGLDAASLFAARTEVPTEAGDALPEEAPSLDAAAPAPGEIGADPGDGQELVADKTFGPSAYVVSEDPSLALLIEPGVDRQPLA